MTRLQLDILMGKDESIDVQDVLIARQEERNTGMQGPGGLIDLHGVMEAKRFA